MAEQGIPSTGPNVSASLYWGRFVRYHAKSLASLPGIAQGKRPEMTWCPAIVINSGYPDEEGEVAVAYHHPVDGFQWTDRAKVHDIALDVERRLAEAYDDIFQKNKRLEEIEDQLIAERQAHERTIKDLVDLRQGKGSRFDLAQLGQAGLELHSKDYMRLLESKAQAYDDLAGRLVSASVKGAAPSGGDGEIPIVGTIE